MTCETMSGSHERFALPTPSRMPATGSTETGSIMHLPIFCRDEKAFLKEGMFRTHVTFVRRVGTSARTSCADSAASARCGELATFVETEPRICAFTAGIAGRLTLSSSTPRPRRIGTACGSLAMPPQTPTVADRLRAPRRRCAR